MLNNMLKEWFSQKNKRRHIVTVTDKDFLDFLENKFKEDEDFLYKVCGWLEENYDFSRRMIKKKDLDLKIKACIGYLVIAITSGEIKEKDLKEFVEKKCGKQYEV